MLISYRLIFNGDGSHFGKLSHNKNRVSVSHRETCIGNSCHTGIVFSSNFQTTRKRKVSIAGIAFEPNVFEQKFSVGATEIRLSDAWRSIYKTNSYLIEWSWPWIIT